MAVPPDVSGELRFERLRTLPPIAREVLELRDNPRRNLRDLVALTRRDPVLTAKILRLASSVAYCNSGGVTNLELALVLLGMDRACDIILAASLLEGLDETSTDPAVQRSLWRHSLATAELADGLARVLDLPDASSAFVCGLLHDIGVHVLEQHLPEQATEVRRLLQEEGRQRGVVERMLLRSTHRELGARLVIQWGLGSAITAAVAHHDRPERSLRHGSLVALVHLADRLAEGLGYAIDERPSKLRIAEGTWERILGGRDVAATRDPTRLALTLEECLARADIFLDVFVHIR